MQSYADSEGFRSLIPARTDRIALIGMTGSGKTTLARYLLAGKLPNGSERKYRVVADYKGRIDWPEYEVHKSLKSLVKSKTPALLYRPSYAESQDQESISLFWEWIYRRGGTTVYVDETTAITNGNNYPFHYGSCFVRGRELGIEVWSATQRPSRIPQIILSESEHTYCFCLKLPQDRERIEQNAAIPREQIAGLQKQQFYYARLDGSVRGPMRLTLP